MDEDSDSQEMQELSDRFGTNLRLTDKERGGIIIDRKAIDDALLGFQYTVLVDVLTSKEVNGEALIDRFTPLWRGREGVSIRYIGDRRFLARIMGQGDLERVVDADLPWIFKNDLVMVTDRTGTGRNRWAALSFGVFLVHIHNVPPLSMTVAVAEAIGGLLGHVRKVDTFVSCDCIGRFLQVKVWFNVREPLMRGTFVNFPDEGNVWVDFKYEALPKYCLICGCLGHATRVCRELQDGVLDEGRSMMDPGIRMPYQGLDAVTEGLGARIMRVVRGGCGLKMCMAWEIMSLLVRMRYKMVGMALLRCGWRDLNLGSIIWQHTYRGCVLKMMTLGKPGSRLLMQD